jgi:hypothetical protein
MFKRGIVMLIVVMFVVVVFADLGSAALGISPAKVRLDFQPGVEHNLRFEIITDDPGKEIEVTVTGDLAEYVSLDKSVLVGGGMVFVKIKFPNSIDRPGEHDITIGAREKIGESSFLGTSIDIRVPIKVFVPFPGRYIELQLAVPDGNEGDDIPVELKAINRGRQNVFVSVFIDFFADGQGEAVDRMTFQTEQINVTGERYFRKFLNASGFRPANYIANAVVSYGDVIEINDTFRIGSLFVNVTNFTQRLPPGGIQKYHIDIESRWNNALGEVFADVNITNSTHASTFRTPSVDLTAWEMETLEGFADTTGLEGEYDVNITLRYSGQETSVLGKLVVSDVSPGDILRWVAIGSGALVAIIIIVVVVLVVLKRKKKTRKKK